MARQKSVNQWRIKQQNFAKGTVEFQQDQRILDFFGTTPTRAIGDVEYFKDKINFTESLDCKQVLLVINTLTFYKDLISQLNEINGFDKTCVSINKFLLWTDQFNPTIEVDYDIALLSLVKKCFPNNKIEHFFVKNVKGYHFNFVSPTSQFYIT